MRASATHEEAKAELEAILSSGLFAHAPSLAQFLSYVGSKCLEGQGSQIKEYSIAVEALGRPPDFDQKKDSIVRVEAHRLRKRLRQYYESEGSGRALRILIPPGQYVPQFVYREAAPASLAENELGAEEIEAAESLNGQLQLVPADGQATGESELPRGRPGKNLAWLVGTLVVLAAALAAWQFSPQGRQLARVAKPEGPDLPLVPAGEGTDVRILAGSSTAKYVDRFGSGWLGDRFFNEGAVFSTPPGYRIAGTRDPAIFQSRREGTFKYDIPLKPGTYELHLYFAETLFGEGNIAGGGETYRIFSILANGKTLAQDLDVIADAPGSNTADVKVYKDVSPAADGFLHLAFSPGVKENPFVNAIEIVPGIPGRMRPVRIVARDTSVNAKDGRLWSADRYFNGGQPVLRADPIKGTPDPDLYMGERFGNFSYSIPVVRPGHYTATLRFSESWFGAKKPAGGGAGKRAFDVYCNGVALLRNFDIFKEAGGEDRALDKVFPSLEPNAQGKLVFSFVPVKNYACVNAIEVVDEGR
jgi:hypothetical protein